MTALCIAFGCSAIALAGGGPDGKYKGSVKGSPSVKVTHKITNDGGKLKRFKTVMTAVCVVGTQVQLEPVTVGIKSAKIKADGTFKGRYKPRAKYDLHYRGKLKASKDKASGHVEGKINQCSIKFDWSSKRK